MVVVGPTQSQVMQSALLYFDESWLNMGARQFSVDYDAYRDDSIWSRVRYWVMEFSGFSSF